MQDIARKLQSQLVTASAALLCTVSVPAMANPLIEHWATTMYSGPSGPTYGELRQEFVGKVEDAAAAVQECGGCADAQAELDALLDEEDQFQRMAGRVLTMTGQPPAAFRMLGIRPPSFADYAASFPSMYERGEGVVNTNPDWLKDAPDFCQRPVSDYLRAVRTYQDRARSVSIEFLKSPGGEYYEAYRVFRACWLKDYSEFERLMELRKARAAGQIHPEIEPIGAYNKREEGTIYYGDVHDDFMPPMPPVDVVKEVLGSKEVRYVRVISNKKQDDRLTKAIVMPFSGAYIEGKYDGTCSMPRAQRLERARRYCEDLNEIHRFKPNLLQCGYRTTGNFGMMAQRFVFYWYSERVELANIDYLLPRDHNHPLLVFGDARSSCPATWQQASSGSDEYQASLGRQRGKIAQIAMTVALPESEYMRELREASRIAGERLRERMDVTKAYELPGYYTLDYEPSQSTGEEAANRGAPVRTAPSGRPQQSSSLWTGRSVVGECIVAQNPEFEARYPHLMANYEVGCWSDSQVSVGNAVQANGVTFSVAFMPSNQFLLDENEADTLESDVRGEKITLRRKRDLIPMGAVPLEGDYLLQLAYGGDYFRAHCSFDYTSERKSALRLYCIDDQGRYLQSQLAIDPSLVPTAQLLKLGGLLYFPSWQEKFAGRRRQILLGGMDPSDMFVLVDPAFDGDSPRDARLLLFGGVGTAGSLQRIERDETMTGEDDPANVSGHWTGDFQCAQTRDMKAELYLKDEGKGGLRDVNGTFVIRDSRYGAERVLGYAVSGEYLSSVGSLKLEPGEWIKTVPQVGYNSFGLRGTAFFTNAASADGSARIRGDLTEKTCTDIQLARVSRIVPDSIPFESEPEPAAAETAPDTQVAVATSSTATAGSAAPSPADGAGPVIELSTDKFPTGYPVPVTVSGLPGNVQDWVAISKAGQADNQYVSYVYTNRVTEGTWNLKSGPPGDYEVRVYLNWPSGGYNPVLRRPIKVVSAEEAADAGLIDQPEIQLATRVFMAGQPIEVTVTGLPGNAQDFVAIARADSPDNKYQDYDYTYGVAEGTWTYTMKEPGDYEIRVYLNWPAGGYNPVAREQISVGAQR